MKLLFKIFFLISLFLLGSGLLHGQINTEKYRKYYSDNEGFMFNFKSTFSIKSGNTEYKSIKGTGRLDHNGKHFDYFLVGNYDFKNTRAEKIEDKGFIHLRGMWNLAKSTNWEFFLQRQYDKFIDLNSRDLAGSAIKYRILEAISKNDSSNTLDISLSTGLMYECENYNLDPSNIIKYLWRNTSFLSIDWLIARKMNLTGVIYFQPALSDLQNYRIAAEASFELALIKTLFFFVDLNYHFNNKPLTDVKEYDLSLENGIRFNIR